MGHGVPFHLRPALAALFVASGLAKNGGHVALAHGCFAHLPGAKENAVKTGHLAALFILGNEPFILPGIFCVHVKILRELAQIGDGAHP